MKKYTNLVMVFTLMLAFITAVAMAQPGNNGGGGNYGPPPGEGQFNGGGMGMSGLFSLDLTDEQIEQLQALLQEHQEAVETVREESQEQLEALTASLAEIMEADTFDQAGAYEILVQKAELNLNLQLIKLTYQYRILHEILTDEQREELQNIWLNQAALDTAMPKGPGPGDGLGECPYM